MTATLTLDEKLDTAAAPPLLDGIKAHIGDDLVLDAAQTGMIGTLALQVLMVAAVDWQRDGRNLTVENCSDDLISQFALFGVDPTTLMITEPS